MELETIALPQRNKLMDAYRQDEQFAARFFDYGLAAESYKQRAEELAGRSFQYGEIASVIERFMKPFGISSKAQQHIEELANGAFAVVGGQQAGVLTGPLYSVHKALTVVLLAGEQRAKLKKPVVPVFWIAGEDHDIHEINHTYTADKGQAVKRQFKQAVVLKTTASDTVYDPKEMASFINKIFRSYGETPHTKKLLSQVQNAAAANETYTGFFTALMNELFENYGLLLLDAAYKPLREMESAYFSQMIENAQQVAQSVYRTEQQFDSLGFGKPIESEAHDANLFYVHETGRVLLKRQDGKFINEQSGLSFDEQELHEIAQNEPWLLSNNVVTRPIMQDFVLPVLAFVGGPGEIAYWALLKEAFHLLGIRMPLVVPRLSITLVDRQVQEALKMTGVSLQEVFAGKLPAIQEEWLSKQRDERFDQLLSETKQQLNGQYAEIHEHIKTADPGMLPVLEKNLHFVNSQLAYLQKEKERSLLSRHEVQYNRYDTINEQIFPGGSLQERLYSPYAYMNQFGSGLISELMEQPFVFDGSHQVVYL